MTVLGKALGISALPIIGLFLIWLFGEALKHATLGYILMGLLLIAMSLGSWGALYVIYICGKDAFGKKEAHGHHGHGPAKKPAPAPAVTANTAYQPGDWRKVLEAPPSPRGGRSGNRRTR